MLFCLLQTCATSEDFMVLELITMFCVQGFTSLFSCQYTFRLLFLTSELITFITCDTAFNQIWNVTFKIVIFNYSCLKWVIAITALFGVPVTLVFSVIYWLRKIKITIRVGYACVNVLWFCCWALKEVSFNFVTPPLDL